MSASEPHDPAATPTFEDRAVTEPAGGEGRRNIPVGLSLLALVAGGCVLVLTLAVLFAEAAPGRAETRTRSWPFDRAVSGLEVRSGQLTTGAGRAEAVGATANEPLVALEDQALAAGQIRVVAVQPQPGWGVVLRWSGPSDHWLVAVPVEGGPLSIARVVDGDVEVMATAAETLSPGAEVEVRFDRRRIDLRVDGTLVAHARGVDDAGGRAGLWAGAPGAVWGPLEVGPRPGPVLTPEG